MDFIANVFRRLEEDGWISRIPVTEYTPSAFDALGRMIGACNTCQAETTATCPECKFFLCRSCRTKNACDVCTNGFESRL